MSFLGFILSLLQVLGTIVGLLWFAASSGLAALGSSIRFLFETWIVQSMFGAWVVFALQQRHQRSVWRSEHLRHRYDQRVAAVRAFFELVDKRTYASLSYLATLALPLDNDEWVKERERYREIVREWNEKAPSLLVVLLTLLPARLCFALEREVFPAFAEVEVMLRRIRVDRASSDATRAMVRERIAALSEEAKRALAAFLSLARHEQLLIEQRPTISTENIPYLSFGYLITSLFKSTVDS